MVREVEYNGRVHAFPDDATDAEIEAVLEASEAQPPAPPAGARPRRPPPRVDPMSRLSEAQRTQLAQRAAAREMTRNMMPGISTVAQPFVNMALDPDRRASVGRSMQGALRDLQSIPSLDFGRLAQDTVTAAREGVEGLPQLGSTIVNNLPAIARGITYGPFEDEERAQRELDAARMLGDAQGVRTAADEANAQTGGATANVVGFGAGSLVRTPLQAAGLAGALDAPFALSRNAGTETLQERLPEALTEIGASTAFGGTVQYGANRLSEALSRPPRTGQMVQRFDEAGVDPSLAAVNGGGVSGIVTNAIGDNLAAGPMVRARGRRQLTQASEASDRVAQGYGQPRPIEEAGRVIERGVERFSRARDLPNPNPGTNPMQVSTRDWSFAGKANAVFDHVLEPILDNPAELTRTTQVLDDIGRQADAPAVRQFQADPTLTAFERLVRRFSRSRDSITPTAASAEDLAAMVQDLEAARRAVGEGDRGLGSWVRRQGGIRDDRGDIRGLDPRGVGASSMLSRNGSSIDDLAVRAWEDGFFPGDAPPTAREFLDALDGDIRNPGSMRRPDDAVAANAREVLRWYEQNGVDVTLRGPALQRALRPLLGVDEGTAGQPPTLRDLRELRRKIRMAQDAPGLSQTVDNAALQRLEAALTEDIYAAAGGVADNLRVADRFYRRNRQRIDNVLSDFAQGEPGRAIPRILALAKPNGNTRSLAALRGALRDDEWRTVVASIIEHIGQPTSGASDFSARLGFSAARFSTAYRAMSPAARRIIFGSRAGGRGAQGAGGAELRGLADELDNLATVVQSLKGVEATQNASRSGAYVSNLGTGAMAVTSLPATLTMIAGLGLLGEVLTNPAAVRWLTSAPRGRSATAQGYRRWIGQFAQIASRDPALMPVYHELVASQALESAPPESGFSDRPRRPLPVQ